MAQTPYNLAMVICDQIVRDPTTGKPTLFGCFAVMGATEFPVTTNPFSVYVVLSDGMGIMPVALTLTDVDEQMELFKGEGEANFPDPRMVAELEFRIPPITFPQPGEYRLQLHVNREFVIERRLMLNQFPRKQEQS